MKYRYTYESECDIPKACYWEEDTPTTRRMLSCPFLSFQGLRCSTPKVVCHCECRLVPWTNGKPTPRFEVNEGKRWERCPISRKRVAKEDEE